MVGLRLARLNDILSSRIRSSTGSRSNQACSCVQLPYHVVLRVALRVGTTTIKSLHHIYQSLWLAQLQQIRHIHLGRGFKIPFPSSVAYRSLIRTSKLVSYFLHLALITVDDAVSMSSPPNSARLAVRCSQTNPTARTAMVIPPRESGRVQRSIVTNSHPKSNANREQ